MMQILLDYFDNLNTTLDSLNLLIPGESLGIKNRELQRDKKRTFEIKTKSMRNDQSKQRLKQMIM